MNLPASDIATSASDSPSAMATRRGAQARFSPWTHLSPDGNSKLSDMIFLHLLGCKTYNLRLKVRRQGHCPIFGFTSFMQLHFFLVLFGLDILCPIGDYCSLTSRRFIHCNMAVQTADSGMSVTITTWRGVIDQQRSAQGVFCRQPQRNHNLSPEIA